MASQPGKGGAIPKRTDQRRRRNAPTGPPVESAPGVPVGPTRSAADSSQPTGPSPDGNGLPAASPPPPARESWVEPMREWYLALTLSQQRAWFEPSDWATAVLWCDLMSAKWPPPAVLVASFSAASSELLVTEGARRRLKIELARAKPVDRDEDEAGAFVLHLAQELADDATG